MRGDTGNGGLGIGRRAGHEVEAARALAVETEVLRVRLRDYELEALLDEVADRPSILSQVARGETLVCGVEEGEVFLCANHFGDLLPLVLCRVDAGGVVSAGVEHDDGALVCGLAGVDEAVEVEALGLLGEVGVGFCGDVDVGEDLEVVGPGWVGEVGGAVLLVEFGEEEGAEVDCAGAGDGLKTGNLVEEGIVSCKGSRHGEMG